MKRWWIAVQIGPHLFAWWPFDRRATYERTDSRVVGVMSAFSDRTPAPTSRASSGLEGDA